MPEATQVRERRENISKNNNSNAESGIKGDRQELQKETSPRSKTKEWEVKPQPSAGNPKVTTVLDPKNATGTVVVYQQTHYIQGLTIDNLIATGERQAQILKQLLHDRPPHLLMEGEFGDDKGLEDTVNIFREQMKMEFPDGFDINKLTNHQKIFLAKNGSGWMYAALNANARLHAGTTADAHEILLKAVSKHTPGDPEYNKIIKEFREKITMGVAQKFSERFPGQSFGLLYGRDHEWSLEDMPDPSKPLAIKTVDWGKITDSFSIAGNIIREKDAKQQGALINKAKSIDVGCIAFIQSEELQIKAFKKMVTDSRVYKDAGEMRDRLLEYAEAVKRPKLAAIVDECYKNKTGPFARFEPDKKSLATFKKIPAEDIFSQTEHIRLETDPATQKALLAMLNKVETYLFEEIIDNRDKLSALKKLDVSYFNGLVEKGANKDEVAKQLHGLLLSSFEDLTDAISKAFPSPQSEAAAALRKEIDRMYQEKDGPFKMFK